MRVSLLKVQFVFYYSILAVITVTPRIHWVYIVRSTVIITVHVQYFTINETYDNAALNEIDDLNKNNVHFEDDR